MKPVERFFRKYFLSMFGIILLFLLLNAILLFSVLFWAWKASDTPSLSPNNLRESISADAAGNITADEGLTELLEDYHAWVMLLKDDRSGIIQTQPK